jgi:endonuclease YncB( thermonuclease family)
MSRGPGKWQKLLVRALEVCPWFPLLDTAYMMLGRPLSRSEYTALHRAAKRLEAEGRCITVLVWDKDGLGRRLCTCIGRAGFALPDGILVKSLSVERVTKGTASTYKGSLRWIAKETRMSRMSIWRSLKMLEVHEAETHEPVAEKGATP